MIHRDTDDRMLAADGSAGMARLILESDHRQIYLQIYSKCISRPKLKF
jgi:hypothetical protein